jgi:FAD/FMN-containing dehydrogenase
MLTTSRRRFLTLGTRALVGAALLKGLPRGLAGEFNDAPWADLARQMQGRLVRPGDADFASLNVQWALQYITELPTAIARCTSEADVIACVRWAVANKIPFSTRSGGHSYGGFSRSPGLIVDLGLIRSVEVDGAAGRVTAGGGSLNGTLFEPLKAAGLAYRHGSCPNVGLAGLLTGGGITLTMRDRGLACDGLESTRMVLWDGSVISCSETENPEVFWAVRGAGGGNFGIHTQFTLRTFPALPTTRFNLRWYSNLEAVFDRLHELALTGPSTLAIRSAVASTTEPEGRRVHVRTSGQLYGSEDELMRLLRPALDVATPELMDIKTEPYWDSQAFLASNELTAYQHNRSRFFFGPVSTTARDAVFSHVRNWNEAAGTGLSVTFHTLGGRIREMGPEDTSVPFRDATLLAACVVSWKAEHVDLSPSYLPRVDALYDELAPYASSYSFINFPDRRLAQPLVSYHGVHLPRLMSVKQRVDPRNVFRHLQSIVPLNVQNTPGGREVLIPRPKGFEKWILESSPTVDGNGPWTPVEGVGSASEIRIPTDRIDRFFRLRSP